MLMKNVWVPAEQTFKFRESVDPTTGKAEFIMEGLMLPFGRISRNNVMYNKESILDKHKSLIGRPVMYNHQIEGNNYPVGHYVDSYCVETADAKHPTPGWYYKADIDPHEKDIIRKLERKDLRHVSIQLVGGRVVERLEAETGRQYSEAFVADVIEGSIVPAPGFLDTTAMFAEAFQPAIGAGPIIPDTQQDNSGVKPSETKSTSHATKKEENHGGTNMPKLKENEVKQDTQGTASGAGAADKGTPLDPKDVGQNTGSGMIAKENERNVDTQAPGSDAGMSDKGTPLNPKGAAQDTPGAEQKTAKMEGAEEPDEDDLEEAFREFRKAKMKLEKAKRKKEAACEEDSVGGSDAATKQMEAFREQYEDDMTKMTEIVERLKEEIDTIKKTVGEMGEASEKPAEPSKEPQPPMTERATLKNIFTESVKQGESSEAMNKAVRNVLYG